MINPPFKNVIQKKKCPPSQIKAALGPIPSCSWVNLIYLVGASLS